MRGLTIAIVAGAVVLIVAIALMVQRDDLTATPPSPAASRPAAPAPGQAQRRSERVEDRLSQLRQERRELGIKPPQAKPRELPTASERQMQMMLEDDEDEGEDDPEELEELKTTLFKNPDADERIGAVLMLTGDEGPESLRVLLEAMDDPDPEVRLAVVEAIGDRSDDIAAAALTPALSDSDAEVRFEAVSILGDMEDDPEALTLVRGALADPDEDVRALAEGILDFSDNESARRPGS